MSELIAIERINAVDVFVDRGLEPFLETIEREARAVALDISTEPGRKEVASLAYRIARSKTALDDLGKNLTEEWKARSKVVDAERKRVRDRLDALRDEIRLPLTEWENKEKARVARHEANLAEIEEAGRFTAQNWQSLPLEAMRDRVKEITIQASCDWQEFESRGKHAVDGALAAMAEAIERRERYDDEQRELEKLRQEKAERERKAREELIAAEAAARAKAEAEAKAKEEVERAERRAREAETARKAAEEQAERDRVAAQVRSRREAEAAAQAERERIELTIRAEAEAAAKREADRNHRAKINKEALAGLVEAGIPGDMARLAVEAIAKGQVPNIKIMY